MKFGKWYQYVVCFVLMGSSGCQIQGGYENHQDRITPQSVTFNYILTHGMCMGYLGGKSSISVEEFRDLFQKDQNAKFYIIRALTQPTRQNLQEAQNSVQTLIDAIQPQPSNRPINQLGHE